MQLAIMTKVCYIPQVPQCTYKATCIPLNVYSVVLLLSLMILYGGAMGTLIEQEELLGAVGDGITVTCSCESCSHIEWQIPGHGANTTRRDVGPSGLSQFTLALTDGLNGTVVQCKAFYSEKGLGPITDSVLVLVQGRPSAVDDMVVTVNGTIAIIKWKAPFSLTIPEKNTEITYCVNIYMSDSMINSRCGITETRYKFTLSLCTNYTFTVTPVNFAGNGASKNYTGVHYECDETATQQDQDTISSTAGIAISASHKNIMPMVMVSVVAVVSVVVMW